MSWESEAATSLLIVEEQDLLRQGLESIFQKQREFNVVGSMASASGAVEAIQRLHPNIVLLGLRRAAAGAGVCTALREKQPETKVLLLTEPGDETAVAVAMESGASGCLLTDVMAEDLVQTIRMVVRGQVVMPQAVADKALAPKIAGRNLARISIRELEVLQLMANGLRNKEIAAELTLSEVTVKTHVSHILRKLGKNNRTAAILDGYHQGLIRLPI
jgi:DNA-binding NarL/FixJ family response regulator